VQERPGGGGGGGGGGGAWGGCTKGRKSPRDISISDDNKQKKEEGGKKRWQIEKNCPGLLKKKGEKNPGPGEALGKKGAESKELESERQKNGKSQGWPIMGV